ncbi:MFS transporter, DHA1 family, multidrug resistance protein [Thermanaeromonas toyohensis ToBE]|uniref:MFS transporter, DHA1 family, multidrug resistance protein n=1 Tax=Thermanaeromonas toyohensis ToBE TaxID=698762 RepID=A0A1W1VGU4_9FIRM|nr:MFS transporter [Thermanaeromonas toyohensis]SMB92526.1 MFS transporter, DHA1 family, multidrug resistance protein [Thermanaeromonas toyohensis ToBE]
MEQWKNNLYTAVAVQLMVTATFQIVTPFLPFFISELGVTEPEAIQRWSGILVGINALFTGLFSPLWGSLSDRYGRKPMLIRSAASIALFTFLTSLSTSVYHVLLFRILLGAFSGFSAAALSLIGSMVPETHLGYSVGLLQAGQVLGFLLGPLLGGLLADILPYRRVFQLGSLLATAATFLAFWHIKENFRPLKAKRTPKSWLFLTLRWPSRIWIMFTVIFLSQFATRGVEPLMPLYVRELVGASPALNTLAGLAVAVQGISSVLGATCVGRLAAQVGYKRLLLLNLLVASSLYFPQAMVRSIWLLMFLRLVQGFFLGGLLPAANSLIALFTPVEKRGSVYGLTSSAFFFGNFSGPLVAGFLSAHWGLKAIFYVATGLLLLNLMWVALEVQEPKEGAKVIRGYNL